MIKDENRSVSRNITYKCILDMAHDLFHGDKDKVNTWWMTPVEEFGNRSPFQMVRDGEGKKIINIINGKSG